MSFVVFNVNSKEAVWPVGWRLRDLGLSQPDHPHLVACVPLYASASPMYPMTGLHEATSPDVGWLKTAASGHPGQSHLWPVSYTWRAAPRLLRHFQIPCKGAAAALFRGLSCQASAASSHPLTA
ncbi:hypothetical protein H1C71_015315 [Ictidomys tridecemlineatus]|nr:hypothetical protein H1C71_015315 [Ictidomys tridecemlineatus]